MVAGTATDTLTFHRLKIGPPLRINNDGWFTGRIVNVSNVETGSGDSLTVHPIRFKVLDIWPGEYSSAPGS